MDSKIICPKCKNEISIDEALSHQVEDRLEKSLRDEFNKKYLQEKKKLEEKVEEQSGKELALLKDQLEKQKKDLDQAREYELELRKKTAELEEKERNLELEKQRQIDQERKKIQEKTESEVTEKFHLKEREQNAVIESLKKSLEEAQRKANQGSQQLQGEVLELELEEFLKKEFPSDLITPVGKGVRGADVMQVVSDQMGKEAGTIIWESKRTKDWDEKWVAKLKEDMRTTKSDIAILVSSVLPKGIKYFGAKDGVIVTSFDCLSGVASQARLALIKESQLKNSLVGKQGKKEIVWQYLQSNQFRQRVEAIIEAFNTLKTDLDKEKRMYANLWAKREKQIEQVINNTVGMYGDMQGLMGASLPQIASLEISTTETLEEFDS